MAKQIINQTVTTAEAIGNAIDSVTGELAHINELADLISESASDGNPNRIEALAVSICRMTESISSHLDQHLDAARDTTKAALVAVPSVE